MNMHPDKIAKVCHEVNRAYCLALGDFSQPAWEDAPQWQRESAYIGVELHINNPDTTPEESHAAWVKDKIEQGWVYGPLKDEFNRTHPCIVEYRHLPLEQRAKDYIFQAVVKQLSNIKD
jgi:hypothetical protein